MFTDSDFFIYLLAWGWNSGQSSPTSTKDFKKFVVIRVAGDEKNEAGLSRYQLLLQFIIQIYHVFNIEIERLNRSFSGEYKYKREKISFRQRSFTQKSVFVRRS